MRFNANIYVFPYVEKVSSDYYIAKLINGNYGKVLTIENNDAISERVDYIKDNNIVHFYDLGTSGTTITKSAGSGWSSWSKSITVGSSVNLPEGRYSIQCGTFGGPNNISFKIGETIKATLNKNGTITTFDIVSDTTQNLTVTGSSNITGFDYILIRKSPSVTIGTTKFATYSYNHALDCSALPSGLKAYAVTVDGETLDFDEVTTAVAANTGLLLNGTASTTFTIPLAVSGSAPASNALVSTNTTLDTSANDYYALGTATEGVAFRIASGDVVSSPKANKAYLQVAKGGGARQFIINWDSVTGVSQIENRALAKADTFFDLQGRKVTTLKKGIYILGGKKVMVK